MKVFEIEVTNLCNADCLMCPRAGLTRPKGRMSWETFQTVADKVLAFGQTEMFSFSGFGEPMLNANLPRFISYVSPHARTILTTNGSRITENTIQDLLEARLDTMILSFNGADAETYEHIMRNLRFGQVQQALHQVRSLSQGQLKLLANVTVSNLTKGSLPAIKAYLNEAGIEHIIWAQCHSRGGTLDDRAICETPRPPHTSRCDIFAGTTFVAWDGLALACCHDLTGAGEIGELTRMLMTELEARRAKILEEGVDFPMCSDCNDLYRLSDGEPPHSVSLNEWIYRLYESEDSRTETLTTALRQSEEELANLRTQLANIEAQNAELCQKIADYDQGTLMRLARWSAHQRDRLGRRLRGP